MTEPVAQQPDGPEQAANGSLSSEDAQVTPEASGVTGSTPDPDPDPVEPAPDALPADPVRTLETLVAERTEDLQRVQAEYVNYKKRVDRDRALAKQSGVETVLRDLIPVLDAIAAARAHDELSGGFKLIVDELDRVARGYGLEAFGAPGEAFDPQLHEALMRSPVPAAELPEGIEMMIRDVVQQGYRISDQIIRPARVVVAVPDEQ